MTCRRLTREGLAWRDGLPTCRFLLRPETEFDVVVNRDSLDEGVPILARSRDPFLGDAFSDLDVDVWLVDSSGVSVCAGAVVAIDGVVDAAGVFVDAGVVDVDSSGVSFCVGAVVAIDGVVGAAGVFVDAGVVDAAGAAVAIDGVVDASGVFVGDGAAVEIVSPSGVGCVNLFVVVSQTGSSSPSETSSCGDGSTCASEIGSSIEC